MANLPSHCKAWILQNSPSADIDFSSGPEATFALKTLEIPSTIPDDSILVKPIWLSNDPAQRGWIQKGVDPRRLYVSPVQEGEVMHCRSIARVIKVGGSADSYKEGDLVFAPSGWAEYAVVKKATSRVISAPPGVSPTAFLGAFGVSGLTAYWGLVDVLKLQRGETLIVSGAAGAVGNIVIQLAKNVFGAGRIIAIVGSKEKADYTRSLGADVAVDYKSPTFKEDLARATPDFAEAYFDNVGGEVLDFVLTRVKRHGRIAACGAIAGYNDRSKIGLKNYFEIITNRLELKGFIVVDYLHRPEGMQTLLDAYKSKKLVLEGGETIVEAQGWEEVPKVWYRLFEGRNQGKLVTQLPE